MHAGHWLNKVACRVIVDARNRRDDLRGQIDQQALVLILAQLGELSPKTLTELVTAVASYVPDDVVERIAADSEGLAPVDELIYREAHARYAADERDEWVRWGESSYQRLTYLRRRGRGA